MTATNDKSWFYESIMQMRQTMFHVAYVMLNNLPDCEDAASSAIISAYEKIHQLRDQNSFKPWLIKILKNECYAILKRKKRVLTFGEIENPAEPLDIPDIDLHEAIKKLSYEHRLAIILYYLEDYSVNEISEILEVPSGTIKSRLSRARAELKAIVGEKENENEQY